jgi:hypothetical protein
MIIIIIIISIFTVHTVRCRRQSSSSIVCRVWEQVKLQSVAPSLKLLASALRLSP